MAKQRTKQPQRRHRKLRWVLGAAGAISLGAVLLWWLAVGPGASSGTPRLVLDREVVDLGSLPFEAPARVVFTLTNAGDGPLRLAGVPRVKALKGC